jgi:hypothetical protein
MVWSKRWALSLPNIKTRIVSAQFFWYVIDQVNFICTIGLYFENRKIPTARSRISVEKKPNPTSERTVEARTRWKTIGRPHLRSATLYGLRTWLAASCQLAACCATWPTWTTQKEASTAGSTSFLLFPFPFSLNGHFILFYDLNRYEPFVRSGS